MVERVVAAEGGGLNTGVSLAANDVWMVGEDDVLAKGRAFHFDGTSWTSVDLTALYPRTSFWLYGSAFPSSNDGWAVGESSSAAVIVHLH